VRFVFREKKKEGKGLVISLWKRGETAERGVFFSLICGKKEPGGDPR